MINQTCPGDSSELTLTVTITVTIPTKVTEALAFFTQVLRVLLRAIPLVQPIRFLQRTLRVRVHQNITILTLLTRVGPTVGAHPPAVTLRTSIFSKTTAIPLHGMVSFHSTYFNVEIPKVQNLK